MDLLMVRDAFSLFLSGATLERKSTPDSGRVLTIAVAVNSTWGTGGVDHSTVGVNLVSSFGLPT